MDHATVTIWVTALPPLLVLALVAWAIATARRNVGLVDLFWSLFFLAAAVCYALSGSGNETRIWMVLVLVATWSLRLSAHLAHRNWNAPEDHRYHAIRRRNEPGFAWKSLYLVFGLQAALAWLISAPLAAAIAAPAPLGPIDIIGAAIAASGIGFETIADAQLARFRANPANAGGVMNQGLWRYSRHPNYFGEFCTWWGLYAIALGAGGWWTVFSPLLVSVLLLKVSGVALLEKDIGSRRPAYRDYTANTNAFFPGARRRP
jgi:steroid 5-alpha reductase family enzyme